jgi:hypothetical protein
MRSCSGRSRAIIARVGGALALLALVIAGRAAARELPRDVTPQVERVGNPFVEQLPSPLMTYARNVWDMAVYDDRLFLGYGNANNDGPAPHPAPLHIWTYDGAAFVSEGQIADEQIEQFIEIDGDLFIPGYDTAYSEPGGNFYRRSEGVWRAYRSAILQAAHVYDLIAHDGRLFAATGAAMQAGSAVAVSDDDGATWRGAPLIFPDSAGEPIYQTVAWQFFTVGERLFVSAQPAIFLFDLGGGRVQRQAVGALVYAYQAGEFVPTDLDPFPGHTYDVDQERSFRVARPIRFGDATVYLGARVHQQQWRPFGLFAMRLDGGAVRVEPLDLPDGGVPIDLWRDDGALYVLSNRCAPAGACRIAVWATCDLARWRGVFEFSEPSRAFGRSFALYRGDFYIALGTEPNYLPDAVGDLLRVSSAWFERGC